MSGTNCSPASPKEKADPEAPGVRHLNVTCRGFYVVPLILKTLEAGLSAGSSPQILGAASEVQPPIQNVELIGHLYVPWR